MSSDFPKVRLADVVDSCLGKMLDQNKNKGNFLPYLGNSNVRWGKFDLANLAEMKFEATESIRFGLKKGDLLVCEGGEPGRCAIWKGDIPNMKFQKALHRIRPNTKLDNYYLYYWFLWASRTGKLEPYFTGTTIKHLTGRALAELEILLPPIAEQVSVSRILKSLDDKIAANEKINQTLEQIAQAMFKSWFVDFEPTRAKLAAKEAGASVVEIERAAMCAISGKTPAQLAQLPPEIQQQLKTTAALFPDALVDSELGEMPVEWEVKSLAGIAQYANAKIEVSKLNGNNYISTENMLENRGGVGAATALPSGSTVPSFSPNHILISNIRPYFKKIWLARFDGGRSNDVLSFVAKEKGCEEFLYNLLYQDEFFEFMTRTSKGAKMPRGDKDAIAGWKFVCASRTTRLRFSEIVKTFYSIIESLNAENINLSNARDNLLPKLLSGEIQLQSGP